MKKVLVDCDPGVDDICALQYLINRKDVELVGITVVHGNCAASLGVQNALKILTLNNLERKIPVFAGTERVLVAENEEWKKEPFHGKNGLCDVTENDVEIDESLISKKGAANAIVDLSSQFEDELHILAIGPLTNLALAMTLDPKCAEKWASLTIMGGTSWGQGNVTAAAEFNFFHDPEAAASVFSKMPSSIIPTIVTWETTLKNLFLGEKINFYPEQKTFKGKWLWERCKGMGRFSEPLYSSFCICDLSAAAVMTEEKVVKSARVCQVAVESGSGITRGAMVIDNRPSAAPHVKSHKARFALAKIIDEIDMDLVHALDGIQLGD